MPAMRLQRVLARAGIASRRDAEELIRKGRVRVNGEIAEIGMSADPLQDVVEVGGRRVKPVSSAWIVLHKPIGYVVSKRDERGRDTVFDLVPSIPGLTYVGRLDVNTSGLLLMTTDGEAVNRLTHPRHAVERKYLVQVRGVSVSDIRRAFTKPIVVGARPVQIVSYEVRQVRKAQSCQITLTLAEGRNRIVRKTCEAIGLRVEKLVRLNHGPIELGELGVGTWRYLTPGERGALRKELSIHLDS
jgi:23S rRNA pseudouridine2605 synthase